MNKEEENVILIQHYHEMLEILKEVLEVLNIRSQIYRMQRIDDLKDRIECILYKVSN